MAEDREEGIHGREYSNDANNTNPGNPIHQTGLNILEKGVIYFFIRGRVNMNWPHGIDDIANTYIILRPIPENVKLGDELADDEGNCRLCLLPKKTLPQTARDRWIVLVEKSQITFGEVKKRFLRSADYETQTLGSRHKPAAKPAGEGVYAISSTERVSHLSYLLIIPEEPGEVQRALGLKSRGSFIINTRNPTYPPAEGMHFPQQPKYSTRILDAFRTLRWVPTIPEHLDIENTQILLIGQSPKTMKAENVADVGVKKEIEDPCKEIGQLEIEDTGHIEHLGEHSYTGIFPYLEVEAEDYPKTQTSF